MVGGSKEHRAEFNEQTLSDLNTLEKFLQDEKFIRIMLKTVEILLTK